MRESQQFRRLYSETDCLREARRRDGEEAAEYASRNHFIFLRRLQWPCRSHIEDAEIGWGVSYKDDTDHIVFKSGVAVRSRYRFIVAKTLRLFVPDVALCYPKQAFHPLRSIVKSLAQRGWMLTVSGEGCIATLAYWLHG